ncbi:MAG: hypothetical protein PHH17_02040 [Candidatus Pacebacteria bacterium]|jgi:hypothetical protein|nr:hypothetical protein [Candidatus Paceibacterota bacterium]MDD3072754.1 hypothetical protein [Candidatus Paceibacterota bacterium]MDD3729193.1 hypothetical protein [Candidatus Paceibacterota bacterium]MDD4201708.1 hypothetical protein [Candidatus Paceibacterota bacterium]MDD4897471.1 hypothetical protein [Candidatus Paceibacterota bacterium]
MNKFSRVITSSSFIILSICFIIFLGFANSPKIDYFAIIIGIFFFIIALAIFFNKEEDKIEEIKKK